MASGTTGDLSPTYRFAAPVPVVDQYVRATYRDLLALPVPEQLYELVNSYEEQRENHSLIRGRLEDGAKDRSLP
jgi:hypothetical protein